MQQRCDVPISLRVTSLYTCQICDRLCLVGIRSEEKMKKKKTQCLCVWRPRRCVRNPVSAAAPFVGIP